MSSETPPSKPLEDMSGWPSVGEALTFAELLNMRANAPDEHAVADLMEDLKRKDAHDKPEFFTPYRELNREFERYGMRVAYTVKHEKEPIWEHFIEENEGKHVATLQQTGGERDVYTVVDATLYPNAGTDRNHPLRMYSTPDGLILGLESWASAESVYLQYPAIVEYENRRLRLIPIFGASRHIQLVKSAIRTVQTPQEPVLAAYPAHVVQARMGMFEAHLPKRLHDKEEEVYASAGIQAPL